MTTNNITSIKFELIQSIQDLSQRGLFIGSKWASEQLNGLISSNSTTEDVNTMSTVTSYQQTLNQKSNPVLGSDNHIKYLLAKNYFDLKEYRRCADILSSEYTSTCQLNLFLRSYALYLAIEKRKEEEIIENASLINEQQQKINEQQAQQAQQQSQQPSNIPQLKLDQQQSQEFNDLFKVYNNRYLNSNSSSNSVTVEPLDAFNLYLYALLLKKQNNFLKSKQVLLQSIQLYPGNWSAWYDLASLCTDYDQVMKLVLPNHFIKDFFLAHVSLEFQKNNEALQIYQSLSKVFSASTYILSQTAIGNYNLRAFDTGEELFEKLMEIEPNRLENIDIYSNILYVRDKKAALSMLAHKAMNIEKYCPETCCIIGNYYSLKSEHEKAILYFQRALKLNDKYLSAWTLIGHEFLEIKNVPSAIRAYRKAVDINPRDYRAWYGLGQTYVLLKLPLYSLHYFKKATTLRPYDPRMWCATAGCYEHIDKLPEAIKCYERAEENFDHERVAQAKLAKLYQEIQNYDKAAYYYKKNLQHYDSEKIDGQEVIDALLYLANHCRNTNKLSQSEKYCLRLLDYAGPEKEEAKSILREIHNKSKSINNF
ncbi:anaphase promoting complex subunit 8 [Tieghemostelium lacteum]|uniref:Anaphase promoting complex subunit 8 n=1 Tax=Tieghemostelium lacteum TaxID=361077 RepID=A0A152A2C8_TIELA|nr:anaphase promoting complex subunit 8 [Tieghemostelium lacteum]|eukprot:KYR00221.1 anaphase promoting complex subunit 8 [Tieghemostelium lacteum]